jgi:hypothetical protein
MIKDLMTTWGLGWWIGSCAVVIVVLLGWVVFDIRRERRGGL